jgi:hypothetical protein
VATVEQVDALLGELNEGEQRELLLRVADRLARAAGQPRDITTAEQFLTMCLDRPVQPRQPTDSVSAVHEVRDDRYGSC